MHLQDNSNQIVPVARREIRPRRIQSNLAKTCYRRVVLAAFLFVAGAGQVMAQLPPLVDPALQEHHVGKVIFVELVTPDIVVAKQFYAGLFGWTFRDIPIGRGSFTEASLDGRPVAGLIHKSFPTGEHRQPAWLTFIAVREVEAAKAIALQNGAKLLFGPHDIPNRGRQAVFADPQGAIFAILDSNSGDPPDVLGAPGEWIWSSLITTDPDADAAFYQSLFNYEVFDLTADEKSQHLIFATDNYARASANTLPDNRPTAHPHWLNFIRVEDADNMAAKVVALGGRVLVAPRLDRHGAKVAVVADPLGAPFGLLEWPDTESKVVPQ